MRWVAAEPAAVERAMAVEPAAELIAVEPAAAEPVAVERAIAVRLS